MRNIRKMVMLVAVAAVVRPLVADTETVGDYIWTYTVKGDVVEIGTEIVRDCAVSPQPSGALTIPSSLGGKTVSSIGGYAFFDCGGLTSVTIPGSVTNIGMYAFLFCSGLTNVTIPDGVASIGENAFCFCNSLTSVTIPDGVTSIGDYAFYPCRSLMNVTIGNGVTNIGAFTFEGCSSLTNVTIPDSVTSIGVCAFRDCRSLADVTVGSSVTSIGERVFSSCSSLTSVTIPDSVTSIGGRAFDGCSSLTIMTIGNSVTNIGEHAFYGCSGLTSVMIPDSVTSIGVRAFGGCSELTNIVVGATNANYKSRNRLLLSMDGNVLIQGVNGDVTIPDGVTSIGDYAFEGCNGLTSVTISDSVTSIGLHAFEGCSSLTNVTIGYSVTSIGDCVFSGCSGLTSMIMPESVTNIGWSAFRDCSSLTNMTIGDSVTSIGNAAFSGCSGLTSVTIPDGVTSIGSFAFEGCSSLTNVTIGNSVTSIGYYAFYRCSGLTSLILRNCLTNVDSARITSSTQVEKTHKDGVVSKVAQSATCTQAGCTCEISCSCCGEVLEPSTSIPALGHDSGVETKAAKAATCTEDGWTREVKCGRCSMVLEASSALPKLGLGHVAVETKGARAATCTEDGWTHEVVCSRCNAVLEASSVLPKLGHVEEETKTAKAATCTENGWTHEVTCSRCNTIVDDSRIIPALDHARQTTISAIEPTCTSDGRTAQVLCTRCGELLETIEVVPALGHSGAITKPAVEPTSSMEGMTAEITCTRCGEVLQEQTTIPALGYIRNVTARQLWPHKKVEVCYEVADDIGEVATSATLPTITCRYGSTTKTATSSRVYGDTACIPGIHRVVWDFGGQAIAINQSIMTFTVSYSSVNGVSGAVAVNTSSSVYNGMNVDGTVDLGYSPFADGEVKIEIDGALAFSSTNSGVFAWQPRTTGSHTVKHVSGEYEWTRTMNVTELATAGAPSPNPPTAEDGNISIGSTSRSFASGSGSGSITTSGSGAWSATASDDWITIPVASRNAGLPVGYKVAANAGVEERTGYIYVSGHVFTITQAGVGAALDEYSGDFETDGGVGSFTVLADAQTEWKVRSNVDWISVQVTGNGELVTGNGEQEVVFTVAPWNEVSTRSGTITAAGCTFTVNQTGRRMKLYVSDGGGEAVSSKPPYQVGRNYASHVIDIQVNALASTEWDIELDGSWISVVDGGSGHGGDNVAIAINENPGWLARSGRVRIGTEWLTINQAGRPSAALDFAITPESTTASVKGANGLISVTATPDLPWTATSQANWLTVMPTFAEGAGNGNVVYAVSPNPTMTNRSGTIQVAATADASLPTRTHTVSQPAATAMVSADSHTFDAAGETFEIDVTVDDVVNWTISENVDWLSIVGSTSRIGPGKVSLVATENLTVDPREANVTIAGHVFHVVQKGRTVEVEYESRVFGTETDYATIDVHPDGNATWVATTSSPEWIMIWGDEGCEYDADGNVIGTGDHTIEYIVSDYVGDGSPRTGTITIGDKTVYITQRPYDLSISPSATWVGGNAGTGEVGVPATIGQIWNAIATEPWIAIVSGYDEGTGSGTVRFTYADNDTGVSRTGKIIIAGEAYTITQAARQMVAVGVTTRVVTGNGEQGTGNGGVVSGAGTYDRGASITLTATANDGYEFVSWGLPNGSAATANPLSVTADVDKEIVANFRRIPVYAVNGESVREGTSKTFTAPADIIDEDGTRKLVCRSTSSYPEKGTSFTLVVTEDIDFEWDLWTTNYLVAFEQSAGGTILSGGAQSPATAWLPVGSTLDLTADPDSGKSFFRWDITSLHPANPVNPVGTTSATSASLHLCVNQPLTVSAIFGVFDETLSTALDAPTLTFTTGGDTSWLPVIDATAKTGYTSARSGTIGAESETWLDTTVDGTGTLTFRWRVDCEKDDGGGATWDRLAVFTNGVEAARIDGKTGWQTVTLQISGKTTVRWSFYRDDFDEPGATHENAAWVDGIIFTEKGEL